MLAFFGTFWYNAKWARKMATKLLKRGKMTKDEYDLHLSIDKLATEYCEEVGSFYFEYSDETNELKDAFEAGFMKAMELLNDYKTLYEKAMNSSANAFNVKVEKNE